MALKQITAIFVVLLLKQLGCNFSETSQNVTGSNLIQGQPTVKLESSDGMNKTGNILFVYAPNAKSHLHSLLPIAKKLSSVGYNVTFLYLSEFEPSIGEPGLFKENLHAFHIPIASPESMVREISQRIWTTTMRSFMLPFVFSLMSPIIAEAYKNNTDKFADLLNSELDLVVTSGLFAPHGIGIAKLFHKMRLVPYILASTAMVFPADSYRLALGHSFIVHPIGIGEEPVNSDDSYRPDYFWQRLMNIGAFYISVQSESLTEWIIQPVVNLFITDKSCIGDKHKFLANSVGMLADTLDFLAYPLPAAQNLINYGPSCGTAKKLPDDYLKFVEDPTSKGTVYVAFGSMVRWDGAPVSKLNAFLDALERIAEIDGYRVIFSFRGPLPPGRKPPSPDRVRFVKWAPQLDVLSHPRTRVFLSHSGLKSLKESICSKTPILSMPVFAEQSHNAKMILALKIGRVLNKYTFTAETVYLELKQILDNEEFTERVTKVRALYLDLPIAPLEHAEFMATKAILDRRRESPQRRAEWRQTMLNRRGMELNMPQAFLLDLGLALMVVCVFLARK